MVFSIISDFLCCFDLFVGTPGDDVHWNPVKAILWVNTSRRNSVTCLVLCELIKAVRQVLMLLGGSVRPSLMSLPY